MAKAVKIEKRTEDFINQLDRLKTDGIIKTNNDLIKVLGIKMLSMML